MRFLCLHGRGTCAKIFELQTARLREELQDHEFVFFDGPLLTEPGPGASAITDEYFAFIPEDASSDADQCQELVLGLVGFVRENGPFDGVMGFSEGGITAAMLLVEDARKPFAHFQCGIFFSAGPPLDPDVVRTGVLRCVDPATNGPIIGIPTAHFYGSNEDFPGLRVLSPLHPLYTEVWPELDERLCDRLVDLCDPGSREVLEHDLGHAVPGEKSTKAMSEALRAIQRTIDRAEINMERGIQPTVVDLPEPKKSMQEANAVAAG
ncbi:hypothetical protein SLS62_005552 [Diatrype stigma]|uniref:Serine hydrolase domain-containing protein n=1 Tax=Diatrype stigma TaxID=117547 RepID=A0AAN9V063_9PEZI